MTLILGIETSCDETAAAVVENGTRIHANIVASQIDIHRQYGGVFPEVASRMHVEAISPVVQQALDTAQVTADQIDAIAVTRGPGLAGSLVVGVNFAIPVPLSYHTFGGWKRSGFGDLNQHGPDSIRFYTKTKTVTSRWPSGVKEGAEFSIPTMK